MGACPHELHFPLPKNTNKNLSAFTTTFVVKKIGHVLLRESCMEENKNKFQKSISHDG